MLRDVFMFSVPVLLQQLLQSLETHSGAGERTLIPDPHVCDKQPNPHPHPQLNPSSDLKGSRLLIGAAATSARGSHGNTVERLAQDARHFRPLKPQ